DEPAPVLGGEVEIHLDVAPRIHHDRRAAGLTGDQIAGLGQVLVVDPFEKHGSSCARGDAVVISSHRRAARARRSRDAGVGATARDHPPGAASRCGGGALAVCSSSIAYTPGGTQYTPGVIASGCCPPTPRSTSWNSIPPT